jgi:hypothetical protein
LVPTSAIKKGKFLHPSGVPLSFAGKVAAA